MEDHEAVCQAVIFRGAKGHQAARMSGMGCGLIVSAKKIWYDAHDIF